MARKQPDSADSRPGEVSRPDPVAARAAAIKAMQAHPPTWKAVIKRAIVLAVAGAAIYLVLPGLIAVLGSWPRLSALSPIWFTAALAAELASFTCNFAVQRLALRTRGWFAVVTAGLAGNAVTDSLPGGGGLLALPILALPAILAGAPVSPGLVHTAILGIAGFVLFAIFGAVLLLTNRPLAVIGRAAQGLRNRLMRGRPPLTGLDSRLLAERDTIPWVPQMTVRLVTEK